MRTKTQNLSLWIMSALYVAAGINHFLNPAFYLRLMPPYLPAHAELVALSGLVEIALGILLLFERTRRLAAWGVIALLVAIFPANLYMFTAHEKFSEIPHYVLGIRLALQGVLIYWAYQHTKERPPKTL